MSVEEMTREEKTAIENAAAALPRTMIDRVATKLIEGMLLNPDNMEPEVRLAVSDAIMKRTLELIASPEYREQLDAFIKTRIAAVIMGKLR
jgi:hypothetical protein